MPKNNTYNTINITSHSSRRIVSNTLLLFVRMFVLTLVNLYTLRIVLSGLGNEDYGIFVSVAGIVTIMTCVCGVLTLSTQRFFSFAIGKRDFNMLTDVFSTSVNVNIVLTILILIVFETIGYWFLNNHLQIPHDRMFAAQIIYHLSLVTFLLSLFQIPYNAAIIAHEEMGFYALISAIECFFRLGAAILIGYWCIDNLVFYGIGLLVVAILTFCLYFFVSVLRYKECKYHKVYDKTLFMRLLTFSGWTFYGSLSHIGMIQGSTILLNVFFGPIANVAFGIALQIDNAFTALGNSMIMALRPPMIKAYAEENHSYLNQLFTFGNKFILYILLIVSIPIIREMRWIQYLWLDSISDDSILFAQLMIVYVDCLALQGPITTIMQAAGKIKEYHLPVETVTIMCVPLTWMLFYVGCPSYTVFISMIGLCVIAHIVRLICLKKYYQHFSLQNYMVSFILPAIIIVFMISSLCYMFDMFIYELIWKVIIDVVLIPLIIIIMVVVFGISSIERRLAINMCNSYLHKKA